MSARVSEELSREPERLSELNKSIRSFFEQALLKNEVNLAKTGPGLDKERQSISTVVIHRTSAEPGYRLSYMNAVHLLNIYAPHYVGLVTREDRGIKSQAIWSNHFRNSKQIFWAYHWLMRMDGSFERLLDDNQIGWHAGNWDINKRSIGICLDNDYDSKDPDDNLLKRLAQHIRTCYPQIQPDNIIGHREARQGTTCPGTNFLNGWKLKLIDCFKELQ